MKNLTIVIVLILALFPCVAGLANEPLSMAADGKPIPAEMETAFLGGAATALSYANVNLLIDHKAPIYCAPPEYSLSGKEIKNLASKTLEGPHKPELFIVAAIDALKKKFPCK